MASRVRNLFQKVFNLLDLDIFEESGLPKCSVVKNPSANVGDMGLIPGLGRSPAEGMAIHFSILAWRIPWTEEPGRVCMAHGVSKSWR